MKKCPTQYLVILCLAVFIGTFALHIPTLTQKTLSIFPGETDYNYSAFSDINDGGNSDIRSFSFDSTGIQMKFILGEAYQWPYVGTHTDLDPELDFESFAEYDRLAIVIESPQAINLQLRLLSFEPGITDTSILDNGDSHRILQTTFECIEAREEFLVPLKDMSTPRWWYRDNNIDSAALGKGDLSKISGLILMSDGDTPLYRTHSFTIKELRFERDLVARTCYAIFWTLIASGICLGGALLYNRIYTLKNPTEKVLFPAHYPYKKVEMESDSVRDLNLIVAYIAENYTNEHLASGQVGEGTGVHPKRISNLIQQRYRLTFKQYLNGLRLMEAKRLLWETDRKVSEIATSVGYANVTHFNRVFRIAENVSPTAFRDLKYTH